MSDSAKRKTRRYLHDVVREALIELLPVFERESVYAADVTYGAGPELAKKISSGVSADIFVGPEEFSGPLIEEGRLIGGSRTAFAHSGAVFAVKEGAPRPDLSSPQKMKEALLAAKAVCYTRGASGIHFEQACERLGIADVVAAKLVKPRPGEIVGPVLVRGEADIGVQQPAELLPVPGITIIGPLPRSFGRRSCMARPCLPAPRSAKAIRRSSIHAVAGRSQSVARDGPRSRLVTSTPEQFRELIRSETALFAKVVKAAGITVE